MDCHEIRNSSEKPHIEPGLRESSAILSNDSSSPYNLRPSTIGLNNREYMKRTDISSKDRPEYPADKISGTHSIIYISLESKPKTLLALQSGDLSIDTHPAIIMSFRKKTPKRLISKKYQHLKAGPVV